LKKGNVLEGRTKRGHSSVCRKYGSTTLEEGKGVYCNLEEGFFGVSTKTLQQ